jgi:uncharacterized protein related to proFAR isomerase
MSEPISSNLTLLSSRLTPRQLLEELEGQAPPQIYIAVDSVEHEGRAWSRFRQVSAFDSSLTDFGMRCTARFFDEPLVDVDYPVDDEIEVVLGLPGEG